MFNFTFAQQAFIEYFYLYSNSKTSLCQMPNINENKAIIFADNGRLYINSQQTISRLWPLTYTDLLLLLFILVQTCRHVTPRGRTRDPVNE